ncbi:MAG TPA: guanylate kinase [Vicinamibacterales bacterium]|jgi:guanylate kinase
MSSSGRGRLFIVSAPSGAGKTTVVRRMIEITPGVAISRSYTSRSIRPGEVDGVDYHFVTAERFVAMRDAGGFLEWAEVFGHFYGTAAEDTERCLEDGSDLVLVIDVQGAEKVRARGLPSVGIFLLPPSFDVLEQRLRGRGRDPEDAIVRRLATARREVQVFVEYDYVVVNDEIEACAGRLRAIVLAERSRLEVMTPAARRILAGFSA